MLAKNGFMLIAILLLLMGTFSSCGRKADNSGNSNGNGITSKLSDNVAKTIGPSGGTLATPSGNAQLLIPSGALSKDTTINIATSSDEDVLGSVIGGYQFTPDGLSFNAPAIIKLKYDPNYLPAGSDEMELKVVYESGGDWVEISSSNVDTGAHTVTGNITHFTTYGASPCSKITHSSTPIGEVDGVKVYSNGYLAYNDNTANRKNNCCKKVGTDLICKGLNLTDKCDGVITGWQWECVEFVHRYYYQKYGIVLKYASNANGFYRHYDTSASAELVAIPNNGANQPQTGDILVSEGTPSNLGHVAIVTGVSPNVINVTQQNVFECGGDINAPVSKEGNKLGSFDKKGKYPIKGWLRAASKGYLISGTITAGTNSLAGATVTLSGNNSNSVTTDANGKYNFAGIQNGSYTIIPSMNGYSFNPINSSVTINNADVVGNNFTGTPATTTTTPATPATYSISGIVTLNVNGLSGVNVTLSGYGPTIATTDSNGNYSFSAISNGTYTITPAKAGYSFSPSYISTTIYGANLIAQNFSASQQNNCNNHGTYTVSTGICVCNTGYSGANCDQCASNYLGYPNCYQQICNDGTKQRCWVECAQSWPTGCLAGNAALIMGVETCQNNQWSACVTERACNEMSSACQNGTTTPTSYQCLDSALKSDKLICFKLLGATCNASYFSGWGPESCSNMCTSTEDLCTINNNTRSCEVHCNTTSGTIKKGTQTCQALCAGNTWWGPCITNRACNQ